MIMKINYQKSSVFFSKFMSDSRKMHVVSQLGMWVSDGDGQYLEMPYVLGRSKKQNFSFLINRIWKKTHGWKDRFFFKRGE